MQITRRQGDNTETIDEFYGRMLQSDDDVSRSFGQTMLDLIGRLRSLPDDRHVFVMTSMDRLCLMARPEGSPGGSPWFVRIWALDKRNYRIEYLMPKPLAPWPWAHVTGTASSEDEAVQMVLTAMERSEGWTQSQ